MTTARLLMLHPPQVMSAILAGIGDYVLEDTVMDFPKNWPIPDSVPRPVTGRVWAEEGAKILEKGEIVPVHLASASLIAARVTGADPKVPAAVIRGAVAPLWPADVANRNVGRLLEEIPTARFEACEGDHHSTPYQPAFHRAVVAFFHEQWH